MTDLSKAIAASILGNLDEMRSEMMNVLNAKAAEALDAKKEEIAVGMFGGEMVSEGKLMGTPDHAGDANAKWAAKLAKDAKRKRKAKRKVEEEVDDRGSDAREKYREKKKKEEKSHGSFDAVARENKRRMKGFWGDQKKIKEEVEDLQELSKKTIGKYIDANLRKRPTVFDSEYYDRQDDEEAMSHLYDKQQKRRKYLELARAKRNKSGKSDSATAKVLAKKD